MSRPFSRRQVLRGMSAGFAVSLGLPLLESALDSHGTAFADGTPLPKRFGLFFWGNGLPWTPANRDSTAPADQWTPSRQGAAFPLSPLLQPFAGIESQLSVITGLEPKTALGHQNGDPSKPIDGGQGDGHMRGVVNALTGDRPRPEGFVQPDHVFAVLRPTLDQVMANAKEVSGQLGKGTKFKSLVTSVSRYRFHKLMGPDFGTWQSISHTGPDQVVNPIPDAIELFRLLFVDVPKDDPSQVAESLERADVLSAVMEDFRRLSPTLGKADRLRVDAHLTAVSEVQRRLKEAIPACTKPTAPSPTEDLVAQAELQAKLIATAMQCDLTRVFSMMLTSPGGQHVFGGLGLSSGSHQLAHDKNHTALVNITRYQMQAFRKVLDAFQAVKEADGTSLLDNMCIFGTSEYGEGSVHSVKEFPVVLAGKARGALKTNMHVRIDDGNLARTHLTIAKAMGLNVTSWGWNGAETTEPIPGLLTGV